MVPRAETITFQTLDPRDLSCITGGGWGWLFKLVGGARKVSRVASPTLGATIDGLEGYDHARERGAGPVQAVTEAGVNATSQGFYDRARTGNW